MTVLNRAFLATSLVAFALAGMVFLQTPAPAQTPPANQSGTSGLNLSTAQRAKADTRQAQFKKDIQALQADTKLSNAQKQTKYDTLFKAMDQDMLAVLTLSQRTQVQKQRQINIQFQKAVQSLRANRKLTDPQKKAQYLQLVQNARNASIALLPPSQRAAAIKRASAAEQTQQAQAAKIAQARTLSEQLQKSETPAQSKELNAIALATKNAMQAVIANKSLSDPEKTAKIVALRRDALKRDLALLNPTQRSLYNRIQAIITVSER